MALQEVFLNQSFERGRVDLSSTLVSSARSQILGPGQKILICANFKNSSDGENANAIKAGGGGELKTDTHTAGSERETERGREKE